MSGIDLGSLERVGWLAEQPSDFIAWAKRVGRWREFTAGQFVFHAGDKSDGIYGLAAGALEIQFPLVAGEPVSVYQAEIGFWVGDAAELTRNERFIGLIARTDSRLWYLPSRSIQELLRGQPEHWRAFYSLSRRNQETAVTLLSEALSLTVRARVCRRLLRLTEVQRDARITQLDLARTIGIARGTLQRCLADLEAQRAIAVGYRNISVVDPALLRVYVDEQ